MKKVKCPECHDYRFVDTNVLIAICKACQIGMVQEKEELING